MRQVGHVVPALPVPLVSTALLAAGEAGLSDLQLDEAVSDLMRRIKSVGAYVLIPSHGQQVGNVGLKMLMQRHLVAKEAGVYRLNRGATALLVFYANSIAHLLAGPYERYRAVLSCRLQLFKQRKFSAAVPCGPFLYSGCILQLPV
jgi:glycerol-3-phosphate O-acyltransferase